MVCEGVAFSGDSRGMREELASAGVETSAEAVPSKRDTSSHGSVRIRSVPVLRCASARVSGELISVGVLPSGSDLLLSASASSFAGLLHASAGGGFTVSPRASADGSREDSPHKGPVLIPEARVASEVASNRLDAARARKGLVAAGGGTNKGVAAGAWGLTDKGVSEASPDSTRIEDSHVFTGGRLVGRRGKRKSNIGLTWYTIGDFRITSIGVLCPAVFQFSN
jgi:hypothetical protein